MSAVLRRRAVLIAVGGLIACSERHPFVTAPDRAPVRADLAAAAAPDGPPPSGTFTLMLPASGNSAAAGPVEFASYDKKTRVEIRVTGYIYRYISPNPPWNPDIWNTLERYYGPGGTFSRADLTCYGNVFVLFSPLGGYVPCAESNAVELVETWVDTVVVQGTGNAQRTNVPDPSSTIRCGFPFAFPCYYYQGITTVTVTPVAKQLVVVVDSSHVGSGSKVKFTARRPDGKPVSVGTWEWHPGSEGGSTPGPTAGACEATDSTCVTALANTSPPETPAVQVGKMYARAIIDGVEEVAGVAVTVDPPKQRKLQLTLAVAEQIIRPRIPSAYFPGACQGRRYPEIPGGVTRVTVEARYSDGHAADGIDVTLETNFLPGSGGHDHQTEPRPGFGGFRVGSGGTPRAPLTAKTDADGRIQGEFVAEKVGGFERLKAKAMDGGNEVSDEKVVGIQVIGLLGLGASPDYVLTGTETLDGQNHLSNHWGLPFVLGALQSVAVSARYLVNGGDFAGPYVLQYNDMSIENGGVFDFHADFEPPHDTHNRGVDVDVSNVLSTSGGGRVFPGPGAKPLSYLDLQDVVRLQAVPGFVFDESDGNHYHVRFLPCP